MSNYQGKDNYGTPKSDYLNKLTQMDDKQLRSACNQMIWLSAYASNNPHSDYHWRCDACYDECIKRGKGNIYSEEHTKLVKDARGY